MSCMAQAGSRWQRNLFPWLIDCAHPFTLGCFVDDLLFILRRDPGPGSLYAAFTDALASRWNVEDEGPVSDLLNVEIHRAPDHLTLSQASYIRHMVDTFLLPDGAPSHVRPTRLPLRTFRGSPSRPLRPRMTRLNLPISLRRISRLWVPSCTAQPRHYQTTRTR
eukprot:1234301-Pleurochrysis_carterae.AAC.4